MRTIAAIAKDELDAILYCIRTAKRDGLESITYSFNGLFDEMVQGQGKEYERNAERFDAVTNRIDKKLRSLGYEYSSCKTPGFNWSSLSLNIRWK